MRTKNETHRNTGFISLLLPDILSGSQSLCAARCYSHGKKYCRNRVESNLVWPVAPLFENVCTNMTILHMKLIQCK